MWVSNTKRTLLVDGYNTFIRCWNVIPITNEDGEHFGAVFGFLRSVKAAVDLFKPTEVIITWDGPNSALRRKNINENYKANRQQPFRRGACHAYDFLNEQDQKENFRFQLSRIREYLEFFPFKLIMIPFVEADDIIAEYVKHNADNENIIYSTDGDFKQLITSKTSCYNPVTKKLETIDTFIDKHGYDPKHFVLVKCVQGDKSDNLPGIRGLGEKTFIKLFPEFTSDSCTYVDIDDVVLRAYELLQREDNSYTRSQTQLLTNVISNKDLLKDNYNIMQLQDVNISIQSKDTIRKLFEDPANQFNRFKIRLMFIQDKLMGQVRDFDNWSLSLSGLQRGSIRRNQQKEEK